MVPQHPGLVRESFAVDDLRVASGEDTVPEQGHLLPEGRGRRCHAVQPVGSGPKRPKHSGQFGMEPTDQGVIHPLLINRIDELLHDGFVALTGVLLQLLPGCAEPGASHEVCDKLYICVSHLSTSS